MWDRARHLTSTPRASAIVADRRPLERALVRSLLEVEGVGVAAESATMSEVLSMVKQHAPELVVLHERFALDHPPAVLARIRRLSPGTKVVIFAATGDVLPGLVVAADAIVEDAVALTELAQSIAGHEGERPEVVMVGPGERVADPVRPKHRGRSRSVGVGRRLGERLANQRRPKHRRRSHSVGVGRWANRLPGVVAATIFAVAFLFLRGGTMPIAIAPPEARIHLVAAYDALDRLDNLSATATPETISAIA